MFNLYNLYNLYNPNERSRFSPPLHNNSDNNNTIFLSLKHSKLKIILLLLITSIIKTLIAHTALSLYCDYLISKIPHTQKRFYPKRIIANKFFFLKIDSLTTVRPRNRPQVFLCLESNLAIYSRGIIFV